MTNALTGSNQNTMNSGNHRCNSIANRSYYLSRMSEEEIVTIDEMDEEHIYEEIQ